MANFCSVIRLSPYCNWPWVFRIRSSRDSNSLLTGRCRWSLPASASSTTIWERKRSTRLALFRDTAFDDYCRHKEALKSDKYFNMCLQKTARGRVKVNNRDWLIVYSNDIRQWDTLILLMSVSNSFIKMWQQQSVFALMRINLPARGWDDFRGWRSWQAYDISGALILERSFILYVLTQ